MNLTKTQLKELQGVFEKYHVVFAYLFGSRACGKIIKDSDYDLAIMLPRKCSSAKRFVIRLKIMTELSRALDHQKVDLVVLNDARSLLLKYVIIYEGQKIYDADPEASLDFELLTQNEYFDFKPFLDEYNKLYLAKALKA